MSALATRLLVLGVVRIFEPANAYQLRRELISWRVEQWANLNPGSIYGMLASLEKAGLVLRHDLVGVNGRPVAVYTTTERGAAEFPEMLDHALRDSGDWADVVDLRAGLSLLPFVARERAVDALEERIAGLATAVEALGQAIAELDVSGAAPPHVVEELGLERALAAAQADWLRGHVARVRAGALYFAGEQAGWMPPQDDPGYAMQRDRRHYLQQLSPEA